MKNLVYIGIVGVLSILAATAGAFAVKLYDAQKTEVLTTNDETPLVYDQGVIKGSGYYTIEGVVRYTSHADIFLNEEFVQIVVNEDGKPMSFKTEAGKWTGKVFRDSFSTVVVTPVTVIMKSSIRDISITLERKNGALR